MKGQDVTYMPDAAHPGQYMDPHDQGQAAARPTPIMAEYRLKRHGQRPLVFRGAELGMAMSFDPEVPFWYEINLYRASDRTFVVAIRQFFQAEDERDIVKAWTFATLGDAIDHIEAYDAGADVRLKTRRLSAHGVAADLAAAALDLRATVEAARSHYRNLVAEFLYDLDAAA
jgi:hypothetical protein